MPDRAMLARECKWGCRCQPVEPASQQLWSIALFGEHCQRLYAVLHSWQAMVANALPELVLCTEATPIMYLHALFHQYGLPRKTAFSTADTASGLAWGYLS